MLGVVGKERISQVGLQRTPQMRDEGCVCTPSTLLAYYRRKDASRRILLANFTPLTDCFFPQNDAELVASPIPLCTQS